MRHPSDGVLRRLLDEPAGVSDADRAHLADCTRCVGTLAAMRTDATALDSALAPQGSPDVDAAWRRLSAATPGPERAATPRRSRPAMRRPVVAAVAAAVVLTGAGTAAANDWLQIFRTEQVAPVALSTADLIALPDLSAYGDVVVTGDGDLHSVEDAAAAEAESGLDLPEVADLPRGISGEPTYQVGSEISATFTFSADRAAQAAAAAGKTLPPSPAGLDGATVRMVAGPGVAQAWESSAGVPALVVGRAVAPTAYSSGVPFETVRDHLLSLPGLPDDVAAQLRTFTADGGTLPLPVPSDRVSTSTAEVDGVPATVLELADGSMSAVVWVDEGVVTAVAGSLDTDEVLSVAQGLR
ncbi:hypothetical protein [uncultured Modestobacter sp.]|uniref:hypothetical protein n=1 Tax=uncultured Modestobacter sp. TaxID=380048 RepID=UPI002606BF77|nr:hypothetical protein [uncultured Modestobacter sp.]